ncbi:helix-turn-helix domain-containing protein [Planktothrix sp. PCC 11201]|uniref:helix-turn-helix domain-containing protein n=1 Tax=Planktothrix sp. PCC 11201 TaxID=1729650 RepID=UPI0009A8C616|nr:helix-turn-helix transcriptional regulator [Planktothrix sp. PCC 11201]
MGHLKFLFGRRLKKLRKSQKLTQESLAELTGLSVEFISYIERGIHAPSFDTLEKLSEALKVSFSELFNFEQDRDKIDE